MGEMPRSTVGIHVGIRDVGESPMDLLPVLMRLRSVGGRTHQGVAEPDSGTDFDQPGFLGDRCRLGSDAESIGGTPQQRHVPDGFGRGSEEKPAGLRRKRSEPSGKALLNAARERPRIRQSESARNLGRSELE